MEIKLKKAIMYSTVGKWFFVHIPKNGGTSVMNHYKGSVGLTPEQKLAYEEQGVNFTIFRQDKSLSMNQSHNKPKELVKQFPVLKDLQPICIVRNPWSRCLSLYTYNLENCVKMQHRNQDWAKVIHSRLIREGFKRSWMEGGFFRDEQNMQDGILHNPGRFWREDDTQSSWVTKDTKWFRIETELKDFYDYIQMPMPQKKKNVSQHFHYKRYYDKQLRNEIAKLYEEDIDNFGYTF